MNKLEDFLTLTQIELFRALNKTYKKTAVAEFGKFILVPGEAPIMLLAHLDTVHKEPVREICETQNGNILMSPQGIGGDDRCGVYALVTARARSEVKPWLLFTCDEETGGHGASAFCDSYKEGKLPAELSELKMLIEIDRKGSKDAVYYDCANDDFEKYITSKGFETEFGSFSDISYVAPELGVAAVNLSSGYYNAHTLHEYINRKQLNNTVNKVLGIIEDVCSPNFPKYEYVEAPRTISYGGGILHHSSGRYISMLDDGPFFEALLAELEKVPEELREIYLELIDECYYSFDELEEYRKGYGNIAIVELYHSIFGAEKDEPDEPDEFADEPDEFADELDPVVANSRWWREF